jgi:hypothetical protein
MLPGERRLRCRSQDRNRKGMSRLNPSLAFRGGRTCSRLQEPVTTGQSVCAKKSLGLIDCHGLRDFVSAASVAESFRSRWGSVRGAPVCNSQASPIAAPQVIQGTDNICFGVSSLVFTTESCNVLLQEDAQYCTFSIQLIKRLVLLSG